MLSVESSRLIFGVSSLGGLGQEGQRSNNKQAGQIPILWTNPSPLEFNNKYLRMLTVRLYIQEHLMFWKVERVFMSRGIGTETSLGLWQSLHFPSWPHKQNTLTHANICFNSNQIPLYAKISNHSQATFQNQASSFAIYSLHRQHLYC